MKSVNLNTITIGETLEQDMFDSKENILIPKGVVFDERRRELLARRNIHEVFTKEDPEDLKNLLNLQDLDEFDLEENDPLNDLSDNKKDEFIDYSNVEEQSIENVIPIIKDISSGEEGLKQLADSESIKAADNSIKEGAAVIPDGPSLDSLATTLSLGQRTDEYKNEVSNKYDSKLEDVKSLFKALKNGRVETSYNIKAIVEDFINTFIGDKHMLLNLVNKITNEEDYLYFHSINTCLLAISIGASLDFSKEQLLTVGTGALLHDIGTMLIPDSIRFKKEPLTSNEMFEVKKHSMTGFYLLEKIKSLDPLTPLIVYQSHERENRQGYPKGRSGTLVHTFSKIVAVSDMYDSLVTGRPYRDALVPYKAMETILKNVKAGLLNSDVVKAFLSYTSLFPVGSLVKLQDKAIAKITAANKSSYARPVVSIIIRDGKLLPNNKVESVDLLTNKDIKVIQAMDNSKLNIDIMNGF